MIEALRNWLLFILVICVFCALAESLMSSGAVKQVGKLVCGLVILCSLLTPIVSLDIGLGEEWLEEQMRLWDSETTLLKQEATEVSKLIIEEKYAAYIADKAAEQGIVCKVRVQSRRDDLSEAALPWEVWVSGQISEAKKELLQQQIFLELGIPVQRQHYDTWEEEP